MSITFGQLGLPTKIVDALARRGVTEPFPIQTASIPDALAGRDICGKAPTGSGKTLAFGLALLSRAGTARSGRPRALVLVPTRELAEQIVRELEPVGKAASRSLIAIYGGVGYGHQKAALRRSVDVVVATPGRLEDLIAQGSVALTDVDIVVVDEADRMADMGFFPAVRRILGLTSTSRQTLLFSATLDGDVAVLSRNYQRDPVRHEAETTAPAGQPATHHFWLVQQHDRTAHTADLIAAEGPSIVFTHTRHGADRVAKQLERLGVTAVVLHGGRSQNQRTRALHAFSSGWASALIATDVAARGIHVDAVAAVIHYDLPGDAKDYLHRSGRTARAGAGGKVVSLVTEAQRRQVQMMAKKLNLETRFEMPPKGRPFEDQKHDARPLRHEAVAAGELPHHEVSSSPVTSRSLPGQSLYVANLPWSVTSDDLRNLFSPFGLVKDSVVITDRKSGRSRGFGFVDMPAIEAATAIHRLHGSMLHGRDLTVRLARPGNAVR